MKGDKAAAMMVARSGLLHGPGRERRDARIAVFRGGAGATLPPIAHPRRGPACCRDNVAVAKQCYRHRQDYRRRTHAAIVCGRIRFGDPTMVLRAGATRESELNDTLL